jgi:NTP pyrophosphatase (non-canonical NTP hydrolase)
MEIARLTEDVETISKRYAEHFGIRRDETWFLLKLQEEVGELTQAYLAKTGQARARERSPQQLEADFRAELADVLCHVLLLARHHEVDLATEISHKWLRYR